MIRYILKVEPTGLADGSDVGYERKSKKKVDSKNVGLGSLSSDRGKTAGGGAEGEKTRSSILDM